MNSKTSYTLCASSYNRTCEKLPSAIFECNIVKKLYLAQQKLRPVIDNILRTATENSSVNSVNRSNYLTVEQYEDVISASQILKEVDKILFENQKNNHTKKKYNLNNFHLQRENVKVNKFGKIYVDTSILIQLIELHKSLGEIINHARESLTDESSCMRLKEAYLSENEESYEERDIASDKKFDVTVIHKNSKENSKPKIKISVLNKNGDSEQQQCKDTKLQREIIQEILCSQKCPLLKNIVVMSANTKKSQEDLNNKLSTLSEEKTSISEANLTDSRLSSRRIKSTGSIKSDSQNSKITDVAGARKIILNCLYDLNKLRSFLETVHLDVSTEVQIQSAIFEKSSGEEIQKSGEIKDKTYIRNIPSALKQNRNDVQDLNKSNKKETSKDNVKTLTFAENDSTNINRECSCGPIHVSETPMELLLDAVSIHAYINISRGTNSSHTRHQSCHE